MAIKRVLWPVSGDGSFEPLTDAAFKDAASVEEVQTITGKKAGSS
jgi:hypothetical protein